MALKQGTLRPIRTIAGIALIVVGVGKALDIEAINSIVSSYPLISGIVIAGAGYLLVRQYYSR